jgi:hypothetical protein
MDTEPQRAFSTDVDRVFTEPDLYLLGIAHRDCVPLARKRLETNDVLLPDDLPELKAVEDTSQLPLLHLPPSPGVCAFCGAEAATDEHIFPRWVSRELKKLSRLETTTQYGTYRVDSLEMTVQICERCNMRWLSVLERDVQPILAPMIRGQEVTLRADEQRLLATWAAKTAFMLDLGSDAPIIPTGFYYEFRQLRAPLSSQIVWLGAYLGRKKAIWAEHRPLLLSRDTDSCPNGFVSTFSVFRVVFQVVGHFTRGQATLRDSRLMSRGLWTITPASPHPRAWPRNGFAFSDEGLEELATSIEG